MSQRRSTRVRTTLTQPSPPPAPVSTRPRRTTSGAGSGFKVTRDESHSPDEGRKALRLTVKMPSNKLREATLDSRPSRSRGNGDALKDSLSGPEIVSGPRANRASKKYVVESESDIEDDDDDDENVEASDEDPEEEEEEEDQDDDDDDAQDLQAVPDEDIGGPEESSDGEANAEDEDQGDVGDVDMDDYAEDDTPLVPAANPILKVNGPSQKPPGKPTVTVTPAQEGKLKSVEAKEMEMEDDDEDLSDLSEDEEGEGGEEDAEGEDVDMEDDETPEPGSRASTPDVSKMTKRQRSRLDQVMGADFLQLPMEPQIKKHLTVEEHAMRRVEMARRRKNLSEKRNEEEKMDTINRLLKKQAPKRRGKISAAEISAQEHGAEESPPKPEEEIVQPASPVYVRWVSNREGCRVGVPGEWLGAPAGRVFGKGMVEEVEG